MTDIRMLLEAARTHLAAAGAPMEALGRYGSRVRVFRRAPRIERVGAAWRVGALLLPDGADGGALTVGEVVRAEAEVRRGYAAESTRVRAAQRAAAARGGFGPGEVVHVGWTRIDIDAIYRDEGSGPIRLVDGIPLIRWSTAGTLAPLDSYLQERVALLVDPPERA